jgi:undecaprenyl-diphosphatase
MSDFFTPILTWVAQHPFWAGLAVFVVAFSESVAIFGLLVPGVVAMFGFGALIATGNLEFWPVFWWAVAGAVVGDSLSFWIGRHYQDKLRGFWPFNRYPGTLHRGIAFFEKYGGKSVAFGRFFGPVRAIIPLVAGMLSMSPWRFFVANLGSALLWAPAYLLPGIVFGASLKLASEVAFRLVVLMLIVLALGWGVFKLAHSLFRLIQPHATTLVQRSFEWAQLHRGFRSISAALADPKHPEAKGLAVLATLLLLATLFFTLLTGLTLNGTLVIDIDQLIYSALQSLRTPWGDHVMVLITSLGDLSTTLAFGMGVVTLLLWQGHKRAGYYLLAAVAFGLLAPILLKQGMRIPRPPMTSDTLEPWSFPSGHVLRSITVYGFYSIMVARILVRDWRWLPYSVAASIVVAVALSRLYLGVHWSTDILGSLALGIAWIALLGIAYYHHVEAETHTRILLGSGTAILALGLVYHWVASEPRSHLYKPAPQYQVITQEAWISHQAGVSKFRHDLRESGDHPLNLQLAGHSQRLAELLRPYGWQPAPMLNWGNLLRLLSPSTSLVDLPVLPQVHDAHHEALVLVKNLSAEKRLVLRLWNTPIHVASENIPLYVGNISFQQAESVLSMLVIPITDPEFSQPVTLLTQDILSLSAIDIVGQDKLLMLQLKQDRSGAEHGSTNL